MRIKLTAYELCVLIREGNQGFCTSCGEQAHGVEPDAEHYTCESCGEPTVSGVEQLLLLDQIVEATP